MPGTSGLPMNLQFLFSFDNVGKAAGASIYVFRLCIDNADISCLIPLPAEKTFREENCSRETVVNQIS